LVCAYPSPEPSLETLPEESADDKKIGDSPTKPKSEKKNSKASLEANKLDGNGNETTANENSNSTSENNEKDGLCDEANLTEG